MCIRQYKYILLVCLRERICIVSFEGVGVCMPEDKKNAEYLKLLEKLVKELKFGSVTLTLQDGKIVQIQKEEKIRI